MREGLMTLSQLPGGARQLPRAGKPLTGAELARGLVVLARGQAGEKAAFALEVRLAGETWTQEHLTWPWARVAWAPGEGRGLWLRVELGRGRAFEWGWEAQGADVRLMREVGPCSRPDDLRAALGLEITARFRLQDGASVQVRVDGSPAPAVSEPLPLPPAKEAPADSGSVAPEIAAAELVAQVPTAPQQASASRPTAPSKPASATMLKGGRR